MAQDFENMALIVVVVVVICAFIKRKEKQQQKQQQQQQSNKKRWVYVFLFSPLIVSNINFYLKDSKRPIQASFIV
jgi:hypothetical protein